MTNCMNCGKEITWDESSENDCNCAECNTKIKAAEVEAKEANEAEEKRLAGLTAAERTAEEVTAAKDNIQAQVNEGIPFIKMMGEVLEENVLDISKAVAPLANILLPIYKEIVVNTAEFVTNAQCDNIITAVAKLEANGFTREEAIKLLSR